MILTASAVADTLRLLLPGFVALQFFYRLGPRARHSDFHWTLWSLLVAAPLAAVGFALGPQVTTGLARAGLPYLGASDSSMVAAIFVGVVGGVIGGVAWRWSARRWVRLQASTDLRAWDTVLTRSDWIQVWTRGDRSFTGHPQFVANSAEVDDLDFYLEDPQEVFANGDVDKLEGIEGFLIARSDIGWLAVLKPRGEGSVGGPTVAVEGGGPAAPSAPVPASPRSRSR